ncbi:MAG: putative dioxygenase [Herpetosiphonaceae bacterium]|nr:MAG: putative dioxygenase [Herpetosiphonaceae bacterium]
MSLATSNGVQVAFDDAGTGEPILLCLPGWCTHKTLFTPLVERLSANHRVLALDWPGHGESETPATDFGYAELVESTLAVIEASRAQQVIPIAQSHAGWVAIELRRRLGERVPRIVLISWIVLDPPPPFLNALQALQDPERWRETVGQLFAMWLDSAPPAVDQQIRQQMGSHSFEMWARAGREIIAMYGREGSPLKALSTLDPPVPVLHTYAQPRAPEYLAAQEAFAHDHPWFTVRRVEAISHFPMLEAPDATAAAIDAFVRSFAMH